MSGDPYLKILALDGGGIRGLIPAVVLREIERRKKKSIAELFDLVVGTSTGGILAVGLTAPLKNGKPKFSAQHMVDLYAKRGAEIFDRSFWKRLGGLGGVVDETYSAANLEMILMDLLGESELAQVVIDIVVTAYDIERREPYLFKSRHAKDGVAGRNHLLRHVARATSAAPTFFEPLLLDSTAWPGEATRRVLVDGGVYANNPAMVAYAEAINSGAASDEMVLCSIGTGVHTRPITYEDAKDWGKLQWAVPVISVLMDGTADVAHYQLAQLLPDKRQGPNQRYFRFDTILDKALDDMDAVMAANIEMLQLEAEDIVNDNAAEFDRMLSLL